MPVRTRSILRAAAAACLIALSAVSPADLDQLLPFPLTLKVKLLLYLALMTALLAAIFWRENREEEPAPARLPVSPWVILAAISALAVVYSRLIYAPCDDTYIFLVYAKNFIHGNGLTFNGAVVEGFSSPLWMALLALLGLARIPLPLLSEILSALSGIFALYAAYRLARVFLQDDRWALVVPLLLAASGDFVFYMGVGLENVLFSGLVTLALAVFAEDPHRALSRPGFSLLLAFTILARPEGVLVAAALLLWGLWTERALWPVLRTGLLLSAFLAPVMVAKRLYFGYWLPNTYYIKSNAGAANLRQGLLYLVQNGERYLALGALLAAFLFLVVKARQAKRLSKLLPLFGISLLWLGYVALNGGDNLVGGRALVAILPLAYVAVLAVIRLSQTRLPALALVSLVAASALMAGYLQDGQVQAHAARWRGTFPDRQASGLYLKANFPPETLVALNPAGIIPYYSELPTLDMLGLNDVFIAHQGKRDHSLPYGHQAGDGEYVLSQMPEVILFGAGMSQQPGGFISDREIWQSGFFQQHYRMQTWPGIGYAYVRIDSSP